MLVTTNFLEANLMLEKAGLNWNAEKLPLQTESGIITDHVAIVREDTGHVLGVHKNSYEVFQNQQMAELVFELSQKADLPIHKIGLLNNGAKVFIQLKTDDLTIGTDKVKGFLTAVNSFDGSTSLAFGHSHITISCQNTFFAAYRGLDKVKHTKSMQVKIDDLLRSADLIKQEEKDNFAIIRKLVSEPITEKGMDIVMKNLFSVSLPDVLENKVSTKNGNNIKRFQDALLTETQGKGQSFWGLFSGVTKYTTHMVGTDKEESKMFGSLAQKERKIFAELAEVVR